MTISGFPSALPIPEEVLRIARRLEEAGFETWCVGGAVRDTLLGLDNRDFDLATAATPQDVQRLFRRTVPVGVEHGTVAVIDREQQLHEVTTFRRDVKTDGRHAVVEFGVSLDDDLARRDFTINAIAYHPLRREWRDPHGGRTDLSRALVCAVGDPAQRMREDYLRILRAARFATRFGFAIEPATEAAMVAEAAGLQHLSAERVREEWFASLASARRPSAAFEWWERIGALGMWAPEMAGKREAGSGKGDAAVLDRIEPRDPVLLTSWLSEDPAATLARLKCSNAQIERGRRIATHRAERPDVEAPAAVRRWLAVVGPATDDLVAIARAEDSAYGALLADAVSRARENGTPLRLGELAVSGHDLAAAGVPAGPEMGATLRALLEAVLDDPARNTKETLLQLARERLERGG